MSTELRKSGNLFDVAALNEGLMLGLVRQHELIEAAELLNAQLQAEIHARKRAEEALVSSEKLASVGRMAAVLAHEINNPLEAVTNVLFLAQTTKGLPEEAREYLIVADSEIRRIAHITRQTLGFYRESSAPATFQIASLLDSVCDLLQAKVVSAHAVIEKQCDRDLQMNALQGEMRQVLSNLLRNSLDAVAEGGKVTLRGRLISSFKDGRPYVRLTVADNGNGIRPASLCQIFEPFFTTKGAVGNGLGLWISKQIIEKHGGIIKVRSCAEGPHRGTTFSVILPAGSS
jgi:two-component system NtrC family sensor kinase